MMGMDGQMVCNGNATASAQTMSIATPLNVAPAQPAYIGPARDDCFRGCDTGAVLTYVREGNIYGRLESASGSSVTVPVPVVGMVTAESRVVHGLRSDGSIYDVGKSSVSAGFGPNVGVEHTLNPDGTGSSVLFAGFDVKAVKANMGVGQGHLELSGSLGNHSIGLEGNLPQEKRFATSVGYIDSIGGLGEFSRRHAPNGYGLDNTEYIYGRNGVSGVDRLLQQIYYKARQSAVPVP